MGSKSHLKQLIFMKMTTSAEPYIAMGQPPPQKKTSFLLGICAGQHCVRRPKLIRSMRHVNTATRASYTRLQQTAERAIYSTRLVQSTHGVYKNRIPLAVTVLTHRVLPPPPPPPPTPQIISYVRPCSGELYGALESPIRMSILCMAFTNMLTHCRPT